MSIGARVGVFAVGIMLLSALPNNPAAAQYYDNTKTGQSAQPLELNPFLHADSAVQRFAPERQAPSVLRYAPDEPARLPHETQAQSDPQREQTIMVPAAKPASVKQKSVKRAAPAAGKQEPAALVRRAAVAAKGKARRTSPAADVKIARTPAPLRVAASSQTDIVGKIEPPVTTVAAPPAALPAPARQTPEPAPATGTRIVSADEFTELDRAAASAVRLVSADELNELDLAAGSLQTNGTSFADARLLTAPPAPSTASALRVVMFGLGVPMVVGFLAWPFLARRPGLLRINYRAPLQVLPLLAARLDQCAAAAATVWTSIKNGSFTRRSTISNVFGG